jgi:hypothetical protein
MQSAQALPVAASERQRLRVVRHRQHFGSRTLLQRSWLRTAHALGVLSWRCVEQGADCPGVSAPGTIGTLAAVVLQWHFERGLCRVLAGLTAQEALSMSYVAGLHTSVRQSRHTLPALARLHSLR